MTTIDMTTIGAEDTDFDISTTVLIDPDRLARETADLTSHKLIAAHFAHYYRNQFAFTPGRHWLAWNGASWQECGKSVPWNRIHSVCKAILRDMADLPSGDRRTKIYKAVEQCDDARGTKAVFEFLQHWPGIGHEDKDFDRPAGLVATRNGTYDLYRQEFRESVPDDLLSLSLGTDYDPDAECPLYDELMEQYQPDQEVRDYLHRLAGAALEGKQNLQHLITWYGNAGGNGKGTILRTWEKVFGSYAAMLNVEAVISNRNADKTAYRDEKAQLRGKRLVFLTEPDEGARFDSGTVKQLTGGDTVKARAIFKAAVEFPPTWLFVMPTNNRVTSPADDGGMKRRLREVPWNHKVPEDQQDSGVEDRLHKELPGILNRILDGWRDYRLGGIAHPEAVMQSTREYLAEVDDMARFLDQEVEIKEGASTMSSHLYNHYKGWCEREGIRAPWSNKRFTDSLVKKKFKKDRRTAGVVWLGISIAESVEASSAWNH